MYYYKNEFLNETIYYKRKDLRIGWKESKKVERAGMKKDNREGKGLDDSNKKKNIRSLLCHIIADNSSIGFGFWEQQDTLVGWGPSISVAHGILKGKEYSTLLGSKVGMSKAEVIGCPHILASAPLFLLNCSMRW